MANQTRGFPDTNSTTMIGRLTDEPTHRTVGDNNTPVTTIRIATNNGDRPTTFIDVQTWGGSADATNQQLTKGDRVAVTGRLLLNEYTTGGGERVSRYVIDAGTAGIQFLETNTTKLATAKLRKRI